MVKAPQNTDGNNDRDKRVKRILYQSWYRGCKETDRILGWFSRLYIDQFSGDDLDMFEAIMAEDDKNLFNWISGAEPLPAHYHDNVMMQRILAFDVAAVCQEEAAEAMDGFVTEQKGE